MKLKLLVFDYNGTLINDVVYHVQAYQQALEEVGAEYTEKEILRALGPATDVVVSKLLKNKGISVDPKAVVKRKVEIVKDYIKDKNLLFPESIEVIRDLKEKYRLAIFTSSLREQIPSYVQSLFNLFEIVVTADNGFKSKPNPETLIYIMKETDAEPSETAYIGDMLIDIQTAKNAGAIAMVINKNKTMRKMLKGEADYVFSDLLELRDFLLK